MRLSGVSLHAHQRTKGSWLSRSERWSVRTACAVYSDGPGAATAALEAPSASMANVEEPDATRRADGYSGYLPRGYECRDVSDLKRLVWGLEFSYAGLGGVCERVWLGASAGDGLGPV